MSRCRVAVAASLLLILVAGCGDVTAPDLVGTWGGEHIAMTVALAGSTLEYDCARGTISGTIAPDADGDFTLTGVHVFEHGGPIGENEVPDAHPARYEGWTDGSRMILQVRTTDTHQVVGTFELRLGRPGQVLKCR